LVCFGIATLSLAVGAGLAAQHPVAPHLALALFLVCGATVAWRPSVWLILVPAAAPSLNFAPWTGWVVVDEFDLLLSGVIAGSYLRQAFERRVVSTPRDGRTRADTAAIAAASLLGIGSLASLARGLSGVGDGPLDLFQGYTDPLNAWRVVKSIIQAALVWPLLRQHVQRNVGATVRRFSAGMLLGLSSVAAAVVWERWAYTGLWNFSVPYRATALFWEMHVGGAAVDAYLALATPFVAWALWNARSPWRWIGSAILALLTGYACLTTFSRGVYLSVGVSLVLLGMLMLPRKVDGRLRSLVLHALAVIGVLLGAAIGLAFAIEAGGIAYGLALVLGSILVGILFRHRIKPVRRRKIAGLLLAFALLLEAVAVLGLGTFMRERLNAADNDMASRLEHWRSGLGLMRGPADWLWGIGLGRVPSEYAARVKGGEFPGAVQFSAGAAGQGSVMLYGPRSRSDLIGLFALTQRIPLRQGRGHRIDFDVRAYTPADVHLRVCEMHLLYPRECQRGFIRISADAAHWRHVSIRLQGNSLTVGDWLLPRRAVFSIAVINAGGVAEVDHLDLRAPNGEALLVNGGFSQGLAHWLPAARRYFVPWHIDNLYLELLIERGLPAALAFIVIAGVALWRLLRGAAAGAPIAPFVAASLCGVLCLGLLNSVMDMPRVAFLMLLLMIFAIELSGEDASAVSAPPSRAMPEA
jgi:hypothetical protein